MSVSAAKTLAFALATSNAPRPWRVTFLLLVPFAVLAALVGRPIFLDAGRMFYDGHSAVALEQALSAAFCGKPGYRPTGYAISIEVANNPQMMPVPMRDTLVQKLGSLEAYCATVTVPFQNNENSLMLLMRAAVSLEPGLSPADMGRRFGWFRLALVMVFVLALLRSGFSLPVVGIATVVIASVLNELAPWTFSIYSFFHPLLLATIGLAVIAAARPVFSLRHALITCAVAGFVTGFCVNMRSSHLPLYVGLFLVHAWVVFRKTVPRTSRWTFVPLATLLFALGFILFNRMFIAPILPSGPAGQQNASYHPIAHPLVLALAIPENRFSRAWGIRWDDTVGPSLAQTMVPDAVYLGPGYESGLLLYYLRLWMQHPEQMRYIYWRKFRLAATGMFARRNTATEHHPVSRTISVVGTIDDGRQLLMLYLVAALAGWWAAWRRDSARGVCVLLLFLSATLMFLESAIIMSVYYAQYHAFLLIATAFLAAMAIHGGAETLIRAAASFTRRSSREPRTV